MNLEQVNLRREAIRQRIEVLEQTHSVARSDHDWYRSGSFARAVRNGDWDRLRRISDPEELAALMERLLRTEKVQELQQLAADLPQNLGSRSLEPHPVRIAMIADEFLYDSLRDSAHVTYLRKDNFREVAQESDLLIVASTWRGIDNEWIGTTGANGLVRAEVIPAFRQAGVPVAFYSKEDPPNYARFLPMAREADYIFTSAEEVVPDYWRDCPQAKDVRALTFGVNPMVHNPVGSRRHRRQEVLFAGSWLDHKYPQRKAAARKIFDGVTQADRDLLILDRNSTLGDPKYYYPQEYLEHVGPGVPHADLMRIQRMMDVQINLNSVVDSNTMFANRAVELQAMGAAVISNYNVALNNLFPNILIADSAFETQAMLEHLQGDELYRLQSQGVHRAFYEHTSHQRMAELLKAVGLPTVRTHGRALMVADEVTPEVQRIAAEQSIEVDVVSAVQLRSARAFGEHEHTVVLPVRADYRYHHDYARSQVSTFAYADVDFVAKNGWEAAGQVTSKDDHEPITHAEDPYRTALWLNSEVTDRWLESGRIDGTGYGADPFGVDVQPEAVHISAAEPGGRQAPELTVVVPVYNNGRHLEDKCFRSLQRSSIFDRMEILLIDDGSTDGITPQVIRDLARRFPQVRVHFNPEGGSGSASRPRNQGLEMASAPYLTYLDPDNEAVNDGYAALLEMVQREDLDFAIGDMIKFSNTSRRVGNAKLLDKVLVNDEDGGKLVPEGAVAAINFQPMSIQALVADTAWLRATGIEQPVGALGQDSLAFQEMLHAARRIDTLRKPIHVYYGSVANSMVNTVTPGFFRKYVPLEAARMRWLQDNGLVDVYRERRARPFFERWLLHKFNNSVSDDHRAEATPLLRELGAVYGIELEPVDPQAPEGELRMVDPPAVVEPSAMSDPADTEATERRGAAAPQAQSAVRASEPFPRIMKPPAGFWDEAAETARTLVLLDAVLRDDDERREDRTSRFELTLASLNALTVPADVELVVTVHVSSASPESRHAVEAALEELRSGRDGALRVQIADFDGADEADADALFRRAHDSFNLEAYDHVIRMMLGQDELVLPWHAATMVEAAWRALEHAPEAQALSVELSRSYAAAVGTQAVEVRGVETSEALPGSIALVLRNPGSHGIEVLSSWDSSASRPQAVRLGDSARPGLISVRWEGDSAEVGMDRRITRTFTTQHVDSPQDLLSFVGGSEDQAMSADPGAEAAQAERGTEEDER